MLALLVAAMLPAQAGTLYTVRDLDNMLTAIDTTTLVVTEIGSIQGADFTYGGLAWDGATGTLYMCDGLGLGGNVYTLDILTAAATLVGTHGVDDLTSCGIDPRTGNLYAHDGFSGGGLLHQLDKADGQVVATQATAVGTDNLDGLDWNPTRDRLVGFGSGTTRFYEFDPIAGTSALIGTHPDFSNTGGMAWDADNQRYLVIGWNGTLYSYDATFSTRQTLLFVNGSHSGATYQSGLALGLNTSCPGAGGGEITITQGTPNGRVTLLIGRSSGTSRVRRGPCRGTTSHLTGHAFMGSYPLDANGSLVLNGTHTANECGLVVQAFDEGTCAMSNIHAAQ